MKLFFLQTGPHPPPSSWFAVPVVAVFLMMILLLMVIAGTVLGFRALRDIRLAEGTIGGAMLATFAAGLLPAAVILIVCGGGLLMLAEEISPVAGRREDLWVTLGVLGGLWLCFLMMRGMYRDATGWVRPVQAAAWGSKLCTAAIVLTIVGAATFLLALAFDVRGGPGVRMHAPGPFEVTMWQNLGFLSLTTLLAGLICGVLSRQEPAGKVCAWISGSLFVVLVLLTFA